MSLIRHFRNENETGTEFVSQVLMGAFEGTCCISTMADRSESLAKASDSVDFILTEEDIPGAKLQKAVNECSCAILKRWLLCRGAKTTGKLLDLQRRVNDYIKSGLDKKYLRDPDGGIHLMKKKAEAGLLSETEPCGTESFPTVGYQSSLSSMPKVTFGTVWHFMIETVSSKKQIATAKPLVKGFNFYKSKHVLSIVCQRKEGKHYVKSKVLPSMKKSMVYTCYIAFSSLGSVLRGKCACPAGTDGRCNHVAATLFSLDEVCKKRAQSQRQLDDSCTSKPCTWSVPPKRKGPVQPISQMKFCKHDYAKEKKVQQPMFTPGKDVRAPHQREWPKERLEEMLAQLKDLQQKTGQAISWCHILPGIEHDKKQNEPIHQCPSSLQMPSPANSSPKLISPIKEHPVSVDEIRNRCERIKKKLFVSQEEAVEIEGKTRGQSDNTYWHAERKTRITASRCYRIAVLKTSTSPTKALKEIMYSSVRPTRQMKEGLSKEPEIMQEYTLLQQTSGHQGLTVGASGLIINPQDGYLGASPDGLVHDPSVSDSNGLLEMKFIQTKPNESLEAALLRKRICQHSGNLVTVNTKHQYYFQLQHCMFVTDRNWIDFVVKGSESPSLYIERVSFNNVWWVEIKPKLEKFFEEAMLPELAYPRVKYGLTRIQLDRIGLAQE